MICSKCDNDIDAGSMWHSYRSGSNTCNICFSDRLFNQVAKNNKQRKESINEIIELADSITTVTNIEAIKIKAEILRILQFVRKLE